MEKDAPSQPSSEKMKYVEVKIKVPKPVMDFLRAFVEFAGIDLDRLLTDLVISEINCLTDDGGHAYINRRQLIKHYGLEEILDC